MNCALTAALLAGVCAFSLASCNPARDGDHCERFRELNEIPLKQLRIMLKGYPGDWLAAGRAGMLSPEPPSQKPLSPGEALIPLPTPRGTNLGSMPVREAIAARKSTRDFSDKPLSTEELSYLLWATQGITHTERDEAGHIVRQSRAAPSAGGRYPLETYVAIKHVEGFVSGLYRYVPSEHSLAIITEDPELSLKIRQACYGAPVAAEAAAVFIWSATPCRTEWKYAYLAHRMIAMEAGHVCENLYLAAESCHIGTCALLSYHQPRLDELLRIDGVDEFAIYMACVGKSIGTAR